ncbi:hypothetical protein DFA_09271 [Cavenderia fasciculata]|uniref:Uncharacterized protein n=1 Tax=Cavenderia fasciculata TaxID=261658 RepID=F4Q759_CACFS|nr:uncharacterized protein DFA_09271 [Cavenderia fasciculata]EGG16241.1 hypothetical protein DFA_09271 [Cavenderia fasciculata]|eukprot:XP_004354625.1 hypothetical protein DFA_09271 [Cavenderia fasciculata]
MEIDCNPSTEFYQAVASLAVIERFTTKKNKNKGTKCDWLDPDICNNYQDLKDEWIEQYESCTSNIDQLIMWLIHLCKSNITTFRDQAINLLYDKLSVQTVQDNESPFLNHKDIIIGVTNLLELKLPHDQLITIIDSLDCLFQLLIDQNDELAFHNNICSLDFGCPILCENVLVLLEKSHYLFNYLEWVYDDDGTCIYYTLVAKCFKSHLDHDHDVDIDTQNQRINKKKERLLEIIKSFVWEFAENVNSYDYDNESLNEAVSCWGYMYIHKGGKDMDGINHLKGLLESKDIEKSNKSTIAWAFVETVKDYSHQGYLHLPVVMRFIADEKDSTFFDLLYALPICKEMCPYLESVYLPKLEIDKSLKLKVLELSILKYGMGQTTQNLFRDCITKRLSKEIVHKSQVEELLSLTELMQGCIWDTDLIELILEKYNTFPLIKQEEKEQKEWIEQYESCTSNIDQLILWLIHLCKRSSVQTVQDDDDDQSLFSNCKDIIVRFTDLFKLKLPTEQLTTIIDSLDFLFKLAPKDDDRMDFHDHVCSLDFGCSIIHENVLVLLEKSHHLFNYHQEEEEDLNLYLQLVSKYFKSNASDTVERISKVIDRVSGMTIGRCKEQQPTILVNQNAIVVWPLR